MLQFDILTIFPTIFNSYFKESIIKRALKKKLIEIEIHNFRNFAKDKHRTVDDRPYGGGPGMILKVEPIFRCLKSIKKKKKSKIVLLTPKGKTFNQKIAQRLSKLDQLILICGRYEGFDERVRKLVDEEISIGDYVLGGGELPAMIIVDVITRLVPDVIEPESLIVETFCKKGYVEYPQYTRPEVFGDWRVPSVLLSGNHKKIEEWRKRHEKRSKS